MQGSCSQVFGILNAGMQAELILGVVARHERQVDEVEGKPYLQQRVEYSEGRLMDEESKGVMMSWENPLMEAHAKAICTGCGDVLNVGFGMGLVDTAIQGHNPTSHTIIEAHPEVYKRMLETGWGDKENVRIIYGRWQDVLPQLGTYDGKLYFLSKSVGQTGFLQGICLKVDTLDLSFNSTGDLVVLNTKLSMFGKF